MLHNQHQDRQVIIQGYNIISHRLGKIRLRDTSISQGSQALSVETSKIEVLVKLRLRYINYAYLGVRKDIVILYNIS